MEGWVDLWEPYRVAHKHALDQLPKGRFYIYLILICSLLTSIFYFPDIDLVNANEEIYGWVDRQIAHPFSSDTYEAQGQAHPNNHFNKRVFRLTVPLMANVLHLDSHLLFYLQLALLPFFFFLIIKAFEKLQVDRLSLVLFALSFCFVYPSKAFLFYLPYHDCFGYLLLLLLFLANHNTLRFILFLLIAFLDERCLVAACFVQAFSLLAKTSKRSIAGLLVQTENIPFVSALVGWVLLRYFIQYRFGLSVLLNGQNGVGLEVVRQNIGFMPLATLLGLEGWWLVIAMAWFVCWKERDVFSFWTFAIGLLVIFGIAFCVADITKSTAYVFIFTFYAIAYLRQNLISEKAMQYVSLLVCIGCFFIPTYLIWGGTCRSVYWLSPVLPKAIRLLHL